MNTEQTSENFFTSTKKQIRKFEIHLKLDNVCNNLYCPFQN